MRHCVLTLAFTAFFASAQSLYEMPEGVETRWASPENPAGEKGAAASTNGGRKGRASVPLKAGGELTLAEVSGRSGTVRRIWITLANRSPRVLRGMRIDMYWDGARKPAVSAPIGDFFGIGLGRMAAFESALFSNPEGRSLNCFVPMPFRRGMRIVLTNESGVDVSSIFYDVDYTLGDKHPDNVLYFHARFSRVNPTRLQEDYEILPAVKGRGRYLGSNIGVIANRELYGTAWWGEGEVKVYLDGDKALPTLSGTGTEDYIGTAWGQGQYSHRYTGCPVADGAKMMYCFYRYHVPDPIYFRNEIRVTIQQIGYSGASDVGHLYTRKHPVYNAGPGLVEKKPYAEGLFERQDDWSSCAYFYLDWPENDLPALMAAEDRMQGL